MLSNFFACIKEKQINLGPATAKMILYGMKLGRLECTITPVSSERRSTEQQYRRIVNVFIFVIIINL